MPKTTGRGADSARQSLSPTLLLSPPLFQAAPILAIVAAGAGLWYAKENGLLGDFVGVPGPVSKKEEKEITRCRGMGRRARALGRSDANPRDARAGGEGTGFWTWG